MLLKLSIKVYNKHINLIIIKSDRKYIYNIIVVIIGMREQVEKDRERMCTMWQKVCY